MSMTAVPISMRFVRAPIAASSGNGDASCWAKWCTRKYAPSAPRSSTASASSIDWISASDAERTCEYGDADQCPNERKPIFFTQEVYGRPTIERRVSGPAAGATVPLYQRLTMTAPIAASPANIGVTAAEATGEAGSAV